LDERKAGHDPTNVPEYFSESLTVGESNDVRATIVTTSSNCATHYGLTLCGGANLGITYFIAEAGGGSHSQCGAGDCYPFGTSETSIHHVVVLANDDQHTGMYATQFQRQATLVHEFGHALSLAHDGIGDGYCGTSSGGPVPVTVMDYDCLDLGIVNGPADWDVCGVNHAYYDPAWGYAGC
jgi:hypothetical protein